MKAVTASRGIAKDPALPVLLGCPVRKGLSAKAGDVVVGWGIKENTEKAQVYAARNRLPFWRLEDGFIGYMSHPAIDRRRLSIVVDESGIYYDAHRSSDLEKCLNRDDWITPDLIKRAETALERIRRWRISKYNHIPFDLSASLAAKISAYKGPKVLVVDQTYGDQSITHGMASDAVFEDMLQAALTENPTALVIVKVHPDVLLGTKRGHFDPDKPHLKDNERVLFVAEACNPYALMEKVDHVYVVTSQFGFEGLIAGKKVTCYGVPFYAGWGLTHDRQLCENRVKNRTLPELFAAVYFLYSRYIDPYSQTRVELERILDVLIAERQMARIAAKRVVAVGFSLWKRGFIPEFIGARSSVEFIRPKQFAKATFGDEDALVLWGRKHDSLLEGRTDLPPVWRMEDGFLRSVGLGSDLRRPSSLVLDPVGIYYDATSPSALENFLASHDFAPNELARGAALRTAILEARVSKYNVGEQAKLDFRTKAAGRTVVLVPGQVEGDASLAYGSPDIVTNGALLQAVRKAAPDAYIVFKSHPDVVSGNREGSVPGDVLSSCTDEVVTYADIIDCIEAVDAVHTLTSLTGFEALLRGVPVVTYGQPFYAGWGLTDDRLPVMRRGRSVPLDGLVYALLCVYARYAAWPEGVATSPEMIVDAIRRGGRATLKAGPFSALARWGRKGLYLMDALRR